MTTTTPSIQFFTDLPEEISNVSLRRNKSTGVRSVVLFFDTLKALEQFNSFKKGFSGSLPVSWLQAAKKKAVNASSILHWTRRFTCFIFGMFSCAME
jgi:hypothetical protein